MTKGDIKDINLSRKGKQRIEWAAREMPVLNSIKSRFKEEQPLKNLRISACLHVTTETANLAITLKEGGADLVLCASNPLSTQDDTAAALVSEYEIPTYSIRGEDTDTYYQHIDEALEHKPHFTLDDGADLVTKLHTERQDIIENVQGGCEETTTGVIRLKSLSNEGKLKYPMIAVNDASTKHLFDNRYGTGQSTLDGITRATNILWAGKNVVIIGYGWCGRGVALRAKGMGAQTIVAEVDPIRALEAAMDGHQVMSMANASSIGDVFITLTGGMQAVSSNHIEKMKDGAIIANSGHFNVEIDIEGLNKISSSSREVRESVEEFKLNNGKCVYLLGEGRLINLAAAEGHPSAVMDMSFANQALCVEYLSKNSDKLATDVFPVPQEIDNQVGQMKLDSMGMSVDILTEEQIKYLNSWNVGT
ncbi:MAG: adenosylhomocysteinase [SAR202 cluster bacterium]|nr:adenosylhomocysteinase [Chloroflexota bacterium]MQG38965.1 adenosylhomocysteinase [SAR202 cluster bacterium]|tara:strand:+ start:13981 stop:15240 length:1260 start_codon:yes stop_codon:yes gene_type:complete